MGHNEDYLVSLIGHGSLARAQDSEDSCLGTLGTGFWKVGWGQSKGNLESQLKNFSVFPGCIRFMKVEFSKSNYLQRNILPQEAGKDQQQETRQDRCAYILLILSHSFVSVIPDAQSVLSTPFLLSPSLPPIKVQLRYHFPQNISPSNTTSY